MKRATLFILLAFVLFGLAPTVRADGISYTLTNLGSGNWEYSYTITNTTFASGLYVFDIYFPSVSSADYSNYSNITEVANPDSTNWLTTVYAPSAPNLGGIYDAFALTTPIALGQSLSGFAVKFTYSGTATLGAQYFEFYDTSYNLLESGTTTAAPVPEPSTLLLLGAGIFGLFGVSKRVAK